MKYSKRALSHANSRRCYHCVWVWTAICCIINVNSVVTTAAIVDEGLLADGEGDYLDLDAASPREGSFDEDGSLKGGHMFQDHNGEAGQLRRRTQATSRRTQIQQEDDLLSDDEKQQHQKKRKASEKTFETCNLDGFSRYPFQGRDSAEPLLLPEGVIPSLPKSRCGNPGRKNVILAIGDGMGYEMARAGAVARQVLDELASLGCNTTVGCPSNEAAKAAFRGRNLSYYYTEGK